MFQYARLGQVLSFAFGLNDATGNHINGSPVQCFVRRSGASADAAPTISSASAVNLTHASFPTGLYELLVTTSAAYSAGETFHVFAFASASGLSTVACIGTFRMEAAPANLVTIDGASATAALSAIVYVADLSAMATYDVATSADVSAIVSVVVHAAVLSALAAYDAPTSADVSVIVANGPSGLTSAACSVIVAGALANYDVPTSADVSAIVAAGPGGLTSAACSVIVRGALTDYDVPTSADVSAIVEAVAMTSASVSAMVYVAVTSALRAVGVASTNAVSVVARQALIDYDVPTSADVSAITTAVIAGALTNYGIPTSANVSAIVRNHWVVFTLAEPAGPFGFASATPGNVLAWLGALSKNRLTQTATVQQVQNEAAAAIASASVSDNGTTYTRGPYGA